MDDGGGSKKGKKQHKALVLTGTAAVLALVLNLVVSAVNAHRNRKRKDLPGTNIRVNLSPSEILKLADHVVARSKEVLDAVASIPLDKVTYKNAILPLAELEAQQFPLVQSCVFQKMVGTTDDARKASAEAEKIIDAHLLMSSKREDVYRAVKAFSARGEWLDPETKRYIHCLVMEFERNGLSLPVNKRREFERLIQQMDELGLRYIHNLIEDKTFLLFTESELAGLPMEFLRSLDKDDKGKLKVTMGSHHVLPILELCKVGATRKIIAVAQGQRCGEENTPILENMVQLRHKLARLLGHSNYADYVLQPRMAKSSSQVFEFLEDLSTHLTELASKELSILQRLKKEEEGEAAIGVEDLSYYLRKAKEERLNVDLTAVKQYFPVNLVLSGIFKIFEDLYGLKFDKVNQALVWHNDVHLMSVLDTNTGEQIGYVYLDIYSRKGKYGHTCVIPLQNGCDSSSGTGRLMIPVALLIAQLPKDENPCLLHFSEMVALFHEFSHVVHHICSCSSFVRFSGLRLASDYVEIPAHLMENWCYNVKSLKMMSGYHEDVTRPISDELCRSLRKRRDSFSALKLKQEILLSIFDQVVHSNEYVDMVELLEHLHPKLMLGIPLLEGTRPASCFPRLAIGHEATCYSHIWSEVYASDIFASKFQDDVSNGIAGLQLRKKILAPGIYKNYMETMVDYLEKKPSVQAFVERKTQIGL